MPFIKPILIVLFIVITLNNLSAQESKSGTYSISGIITDQANLPIPYALVKIANLNVSTMTDMEGQFELKAISKGSHSVIVKCMGYQDASQNVQINSSSVQNLQITIKEDALNLKEVVVSGEKHITEEMEIEKTGFHVDVVEVEQMANQSVDINTVLDHTAGVRVQRAGGMGSDFNYSLDGMTGNSIRFLVDGIPIDYFGSVYNINNFPISLVDRVEVYKGVVPVYLAADALGGAVNLITKTKQENFLDASYSYGSFNTHQAAIQGQWTDSTSGFTTRLSTFYNYSDNDYKIWGETVTYYDESTGYRPVNYTKENPATRFNDDYQAACLKADIGFLNRKWADQFFISFLTSDVDRGVQHGQTMSKVYGHVRFQEHFYMPSVTYSKEDVFIDGLDLKLFTSYALTNATTIDTSSQNFNWRGRDTSSTDLDGGERRSQRSLFHLKDKAFISSLNTNYEINKNFGVAFNFLYKGVNRSGTDDYIPWHTLAYTEPQHLKTTFTGLSLNTNFFDEHLKTNLFVKHYGYNASITETESTSDGSEIKKNENIQSNFGGGIATAIRIKKNALIKASLENAIRLPNTREALGDGINTVNSPNIKPERSLNINLGLTLGKFYFKNDQHAFKFLINTFYRDTKDKIIPNLKAHAEIQFENVDKILGKGIEFEAKYYLNSKIEFTYNITYIDQRNNNKKAQYGGVNTLYWDRLKNAPYLMSNATLVFKQKDIILDKSLSLFYAQVGYVHEYYLGWPSLGTKEDKKTIPSQFVVDIGCSYTFPGNQFSIGFDASNIFNRQVYDNFLLQKPGRAYSIKLSYRISKS